MPTTILTILVVIAAIIAAGLVWFAWPKGGEALDKGAGTVEKIGGSIKRLLGG